MKINSIIKRAIAHILTALMIISTAGMLPGAAGAMQPGTAYAADFTEIEPGERIFIGKFVTDGYTGTPNWIVLDKKDDGRYLFMAETLWFGNGSDENAVIKFDSSGSTNVWQGSDAQKWCKNFEAAVLSGNDFLTICENGNDRVFLLTSEEVTGYLPEEDDRIAFLPNQTTARAWYLRSPDKNDATKSESVMENGIIASVASDTGCAMRPAFWGRISEDACIPVDSGSEPKLWILGNSHNIGEAEYTWSQDNSQCTASSVCSECGNDVVETADAETVVTKEATEEAEGVMTYTGRFRNSPFETQTREVPIPKKEKGSTEPGNNAPAPQRQAISTDVSTANTAVSQVTINRKNVTVAAVRKAITVAGGNVGTVVLGKKVKKLSKGAFKGTNVKTIIVKTKKLKKASVKGSLKGSKVTTVKVQVGKAKVNKKYVKKYKKIFTKKNAGKKVKVEK